MVLPALIVWVPASCGKGHGIVPSTPIGLALRYVAKNRTLAAFETPNGTHASTRPVPVQPLGACGYEKRGGAGGLNSSRWARTIQWKHPPADSQLPTAMSVPVLLVVRSALSRRSRFLFRPGFRRAEGRCEGREFPARDARDPRPQPGQLFLNVAELTLEGPPVPAKSASPSAVRPPRSPPGPCQPGTGIGIGTSLALGARSNLEAQSLSDATAPNQYGTLEPGSNHARAGSDPMGRA